MSLPAQVVVDGNSLTIESLVAVARRRAPAALTSNPEVLRRIEQARRFYLESGILAYGDNMGVGANVGKILPQNKRREFQVRLTDALSCGMGKELPPEIGRGACCSGPTRSSTKAVPRLGSTKSRRCSNS